MKVRRAAAGHEEAPVSEPADQHPPHLDDQGLEESAIVTAAFKPDGTLITGDMIGSDPSKTYSGMGTYPDVLSSTGLLANIDQATAPKTAVIWNLRTGKELARLNSPDARPLKSVAVSTGGSTVATSDDKGVIYLWSLSPAVIPRLKLDSPDRAYIYDSAFSVDGRRLISRLRDAAPASGSHGCRMNAAVPRAVRSGGVHGNLFLFSRMT